MFLHTFPKHKFVPMYNVYFDNACVEVEGVCFGFGVITILILDMYVTVARFVIVSCFYCTHNIVPPSPVCAETPAL
jgi:hypothetical protein